MLFSFWRLCREVSKNRIESNRHPKVTSPGDSSAYFGWNPLDASLSTMPRKKLAEGAGNNVVGQGLSIFQNIEKYHITLTAQNWRCLFERALVGRALNLNFLYYYKSWLVVNYWPVLAGCVFVCVATKKHLKFQIFSNSSMRHTPTKHQTRKPWSFFQHGTIQKNIWYHEVFLTNIYIIYGTIQKTVIFKVFDGRFFPNQKTTVWNNSHPFDQLLELPRSSLVSTFAHALRKEVGSWICFKKGRNKTNSFFMVTKGFICFFFWEGIYNCL